MNMDGSGLSHQVGSLDINEHDAAPHNPFSAFDEAPPPAPKLHSKGIIAMDITEQFIHAAKQLEIGQLVKPDHFSLFEAVGALEIMDKKMDSGFLQPGETMDDDYDFTKALLPEEIIGIIDKLLCYEMAWHMGYPFAQTVFTSLHIDRILAVCPMTIEQTVFDRSEACPDEEPLLQQVLRAYCLGLIKTCSYVNARVQAENYYEEEDFVTHTFHRSLLESISSEAISQFLSETIVLLDGSESMPTEVKQALDQRLCFRVQFLKAIEVADLRIDTNAKYLWTELHSMLPDLKSSAALGKSVRSAFSENLQRKLASSVPPRPIVEISLETAFDRLNRLCLDASIAVEVLEYFDSHSLMTFILHFSARKPQPSVYVRCLLQHYILADMVILGNKSIRHILDDDLAATVLPADQLLDRMNDEIEVPHDPRHNMSIRMETFRQRAAECYMNILRTLCQNRCRIRRSLTHTMTDWDVLQLDGEELDVELREFTKEQPIDDPAISPEPIYSFPLSSWCYFYKLQQMEWVVQKGFELTVYQPDELAGMYWYLQYLARTRSMHIERMRGFVLRAYNKASTVSRDALHGNPDEIDNALQFLNYSLIETLATQNFADALACLHTALGRLGLVKPPPRPYSNDALRYQVRMKPFFPIGLPELPLFEEAQLQIHQPQESTLSILVFAADSVAGAKKGFETISKLTAKEAFCQGSYEAWLKNVKDTLKATIFTSIAVATLRKAVESAGPGGEVELRVEMPESGKGYHEWWTVPKIAPAP